MNNKKTILIIVFLIILVLIAGITITVIRSKNDDSDNDKDKTLKVPEKFTISYSYGGGFGTIVDSWLRVITLDQDGNVSISVKTDQVVVSPLTYQVDKEKAQEIMKYFIDNHFEKVKKDLSQDDVLDAGSSYLEVKSDVLNREVGGYAAFLDSKFKKFRDKFYEIVDNDKVNEFDKLLKETYEKE
jgi:type III secretory pathway component EscV